jgi:hypothetical protein
MDRGSNHAGTLCELPCLFLDDTFFFAWNLPAATFFLPAFCLRLMSKQNTNKLNPGRFARGQKKTIPSSWGCGHNIKLFFTL